MRVTAIAIAAVLTQLPRHAASDLIVPGHSVGQICIGQNANTLKKTLGPADFADAAMGREWSIWYAHPHAVRIGHMLRLDVLDERDEASGDLHSYIQQVWLTSPWFHTRNGVAIGTRWERIRQAFPAARPLLKNSLQQPPKELYDDVKQGIGFEVQGGRCIAIIVHSPGTAAPRCYYSHYNNDRWLPVKH